MIGSRESCGGVDYFDGLSELGRFDNDSCMSIRLKPAPRSLQPRLELPGQTRLQERLEAPALALGLAFRELAATTESQTQNGDGGDQEPRVLLWGPSLR